MANFEPFNLGQVFATAEGIKQARAQSATDRLREQYLGEQIANAKQDRQMKGEQFAAEQQINNTKLLHTAAGEVMANPAAAARWIPQLQQAGVIDRNFDWQSMPPEELKAAAAQIYEGTTQALLQPGQLPEKEQIALQEQIRSKERLQQQDFQRSQQEDQQSFAAGQGALNRATMSQTRGVTSQQMITRPVGGGLVQDYAWNPKTNERVPSGEPYRPVTTMTGNVTEGERKAAALGTRLDAALTTLNEVEGRAPGASRPGLIERGLENVGMESAANIVRGEERQQADAAQLDALDAALTLATGAAYTKEQLQNLRKSYFPQIGDSDANVAAKQKRFETIVKTARIASGRAEPSIDKANQPAGRGASGSWGEPGTEAKIGGFTVRRLK